MHILIILGKRSCACCFSKFIIKWRRDHLLSDDFNIRLCLNLIFSSFMIGLSSFWNVVICCAEIALYRDECLRIEDVFCWIRLDDFVRSNPPGKYGRKALDTPWKRRLAITYKCLLFLIVVEASGDIFILFKFPSFPLQGTFFFHFIRFGTCVQHLKNNR